MLSKLIDSALRNKLIVVLFLIAVIGGGYWSYKNLPVDAFPDVSPALVQVFTVTSGLGPEEVEKFVTFPVEAAMSGLPKVEEIRSVSNFGLSVVSVYFEEGTDIYFARQVVGERLSEAREAIPSGFGEPAMGPISTGQGLVLYYNLIDTTGIQPGGTAHPAGLGGQIQPADRARRDRSAGHRRLREAVSGEYRPGCAPALRSRAA